MGGEGDLVRPSRIRSVQQLSLGKRVIRQEVHAPPTSPVKLFYGGGARGALLSRWHISADGGASPIATFPRGHHRHGAFRMIATISLSFTKNNKGAIAAIPSNTLEICLATFSLAARFGHLRHNNSQTLCRFFYSSTCACSLVVFDYCCRHLLVPR